MKKSIKLLCLVIFSIKYNYQANDNQTSLKDTLALGLFSGLVGTGLMVITFYGFQLKEHIHGILYPEVQLAYYQKRLELLSQDTTRTLEDIAEIKIHIENKINTFQERIKEKELKKQNKSTHKEENTLSKKLNPSKEQQTNEDKKADFFLSNMNQSYNLPKKKEQSSNGLAHLFFIYNNSKQTSAKIFQKIYDARQKTTEKSFKTDNNQFLI